MSTPRTWRGYLAVMGLFALLAACDIVDPQDEVDVSNGRTDSIEVATCAGVVNAPLERRVGAGWDLIGGGTCQGGGIRTIPPGDTAAGRTAVGPAEGGSYRILLAYRTAPEGVQGSTRSAAFTVTQ
jgi:hypothetical protein